MSETTMTAIEGFAGELLAPEHEGYDDARALWNGVIDRRPALIARATGVDDVAAAVRFAHEHGLTVTARGGGHGVAGNALTDGGLVVDLSAAEGDPRRPRGEDGARAGRRHAR